VRGLALATLIGSTVVAVAGCGSSTMPTTAPFVSCLASGLAVEGGQIAVLSIHGASCLTAEHVMTGVIVGLNAGKSIDGAPTPVEGWNCLIYDGNQATCTRGHAILYAQYIRS
jgi:hypothetical protein